jgi:hypothetical protein
MPLPADSSEDFRLFTSVRLDPMLYKSQENQRISNGRESPLYIPSYHRKRVLEAAQNFGFNEGLELLEDEAKFEEHIVNEGAKWRRRNQNEESVAPLRVRTNILKCL